MQLRDAQTSELIAEGTPLEIATLAEEFSEDEVLFDDAGGVDRNGKSLFNPAAVREARAAEIRGMESELASTHDQELSARLQETIKERRDRIAAGKAKLPEARQAMKNARRLAELE